jgi:hypothetical protein
VGAGIARAELNSLFTRSNTVPETATRANLFTADARIGFFAPLPERTAPSIGTGTAPVDQLLSLITRAEAGSAGYNAVQHGARVRPA